MQSILLRSTDYDLAMICSLTLFEQSLHEQETSSPHLMQGCVPVCCKCCNLLLPVLLEMHLIELLNHKPMGHSGGATIEHSQAVLALSLVAL